jgi:hypothetical protein
MQAHGARKIGENVSVWAAFQARKKKYREREKRKDRAACFVIYPLFQVHTSDISRSQFPITHHTLVIAEMPLRSRNGRSQAGDGEDNDRVVRGPSIMQLFDQGVASPLARSSFAKLRYALILG